MKTIKVPVFLQELMGKRITVLEMWLTIVFIIGMTVLLLTTTYSEWQSLNNWKVILLIILTIDITGGVVANFSFSTNQHYVTEAKARLVFIMIHVQPIILAWLLGGYYGTSFAVWG